MISQTAEYALRAIVFLAAGETRSHTVREIAKGTKVPEGYLAKVLRALSTHGLVTAHRGVHGGFSLNRPPEVITVLDVINAVDPLQRITSCPLELPSHGTNLCPLHRRLDQALAQVEEAFRTSTIAEILAEPAESVPLVDHSLRVLE